MAPARRGVRAMKVRTEDAAKLAELAYRSQHWTSEDLKRALRNADLHHRTGPRERRMLLARLPAI